MTGHSAALRSAIAEFPHGRGYLAAASTGLPPARALAAMRADLTTWESGERSPQSYDAVIARTRASYASLVGVPVGRVAIGSQTSVLVSLLAAAVPEGAEVLLPEGDFASLEFPFLVRRGIRTRVVPLRALADAIDEGTWLVAFSLVQSATGEVADVDAIVEAAARVGALTLCDVTQAAGVLPVEASRVDATVCHAHKWLCSPTGTAFLTVGPRLDELLSPAHAGWYAGDDPWTNVYGPAMDLAPDARRFDVSPVWQSWVGADPAIALFAGLDIGELWAHASGLGDALCDALGLPARHQAIVTWADASGDDLRRLTGAGIRVTGRAGRLRAAFHLWNNLADVEAVARVVR